MDIAESSLFHIDNELNAISGNSVELIPIIGDIKNKNRLDGLFETHCPHIVFHAAAYKHVPLMELNPQEVITNNIEGTRNLIKTSTKYDVENFVLISTDKAVNTTNCMGHQNEFVKF